MKRLVGYIRVSTESQGVSGNGLEAQRNAITKFAADFNYEIVEILTEEASGKLGLDQRPVLKEALAKSLKLKAVLVVSKLDRLSRQAAFILNLMATTAKFIVTQFGETVDEFMLHMYAVLAEKERKMISERTSAALQTLKTKGVKLGNRTNIDVAQENGTKTIKAHADSFADKMRPTIQRMLDAKMSLAGIADEFNRTGTKTVRGGAWTNTSVSRLIARWA